MIADLTVHTEDEAAAILRLKDRAAVRRLRRQGKLGFFKLAPKTIRIGAGHIAEYLKATEITAMALTDGHARCTLASGNTRPGLERRSR